MGPETVGLTFLGERQALVDAESMLLIDNNQSQPCEFHTRLKEGMCAHNNGGFAAAYVLKGAPSRGSGQPSG